MGVFDSSMDPSILDVVELFALAELELAQKYSSRCIRC